MKNSLHLLVQIWLVTQITEVCYLKLGSLFKYREEGRFKLSDNEKEDGYVVVRCSRGLSESICCWLKQRCHRAVNSIRPSLLPAGKSCQRCKLCYCISGSCDIIESIVPNCIAITSELALVISLVTWLEGK